MPTEVLVTSRADQQIAGLTRGNTRTFDGFLDDLAARGCPGPWHGPGAPGAAYSAPSAAAWYMLRTAGVKPSSRAREPSR